MSGWLAGIVLQVFSRSEPNPFQPPPCFTVWRVLAPFLSKTIYVVNQSPDSPVVILLPVSILELFGWTENLFFLTFLTNPSKALHRKHDTESRFEYKISFIYLIIYLVKS